MTIKNTIIRYLLNEEKTRLVYKEFVHTCCRPMCDVLNDNAYNVFFEDETADEGGNKGKEVVVRFDYINLRTPYNYWRNIDTRKSYRLLIEESAPVRFCPFCGTLIIVKEDTHEESAKRTREAQKRSQEMIAKMNQEVRDNFYQEYQKGLKDEEDKEK